MRTSEQEALLTQVAEEIVKRELTAPAILFLDSMKPLSFLGGQLMVFFSPFVHMVLDSRSYDLFAETIENRENVEFLINRIEGCADCRDR